MGNENSSNSGMNRMPPYLWANIFSKLDRKDLENAALVSENWHAIIKSPLPPHIMGVVFKNLSVSDQENCVKVSSVWKDIIENMDEVKKSVIFDEVAMARMTSEEKVSLLRDRKEFLETVEVHNRDPSASMVDIFTELLKCTKLHSLRLVRHSKDLPVEDEETLLQLLKSQNHSDFKWLLLVAHLPPPGGRIEVDVRVEDAHDWTTPWYMNALNTYTYPRPGTVDLQEFFFGGGLINDPDEMEMIVHMELMFHGHALGHAPGPFRGGHGGRGGRGGYFIRGGFHGGGHGHHQGGLGHLQVGFGQQLVIHDPADDDDGGIAQLLLHGPGNDLGEIGHLFLHEHGDGELEGLAHLMLPGPGNNDLGGIGHLVLHEHGDDDLGELAHLVLHEHGDSDHEDDDHEDDDHEDNDHEDNDHGDNVHGNHGILRGHGRGHGRGGRGRGGHARGRGRGGFVAYPFF